MTALRIGEAARRTGVSTANIRFYEKQGLLTPALRADNDYRLYGEQDLHRLRFIRLCRAMDMSLDEVRSLLALDGRSTADCQAAQATVSAHLAHVRERLQELQALEQALQNLQDTCHGAAAHCHLLASLHAQADASASPWPGEVAPPPPPKRHV